MTDIATTEPTFTYASAMKPEDGASTQPVSSSQLSWTESDGSKHDGTEYVFDPASGLPHLRTEWVPRTDGVSYGLGILFMATACPDTGGGPSDYSFADAEDHPDNEQHYRDALFEPWNTLFPDKTSVTLDDGSTVTVDDAIAEAVRRYRGWLKNIHPSQVAQLQQAAIDISQQLVALAQSHGEIANAIADADPEATVPGIDPATLITEVASATVIEA